MAEYVFEELIMNPKNPGLESLIGKEVYCNNTPLACLDHANEHRGAGILREICEESTNYPFRVETPEGDILGFVCIVPKKEEPKPEYTPFESVEEFVERYTEVRKKAELGSLNDTLFQCGMWLKEKKRPGVYCKVVEIWNCGVSVSSNRFSTEENSVVIDFTLWENLYLGYTFLDGSPCGKLAEVEHE